MLAVLGVRAPIRVGGSTENFRRRCWRPGSCTIAITQLLRRFGLLAAGGDGGAKGSCKIYSCSLPRIPFCPRLAQLSFKLLCALDQTATVRIKICSYSLVILPVATRFVTFCLRLVELGLRLKKSAVVWLHHPSPFDVDWRRADRSAGW